MIVALTSLQYMQLCRSHWKVTGSTPVKGALGLFTSIPQLSLKKSPLLGGYMICENISLMSERSNHHNRYTSHKTEY